MKLADGIANGRLDSSIDASGNDEVTQLLRSMQRMQAQLQSVMAAQGTGSPARCGQPQLSHG